MSDKNDAPEDGEIVVAPSVPEIERVREEREALPVVKPESIESNNRLEFDTDNPSLGNEVLKIYMGEITNKGMGFKVISKPGLEKILPPEYVAYICQNVGRFMVDSIKFLSANNEKK